MQRLPKQIACVELDAVLADLYTVPANTKATISACSVTNKSAVARLVTVTLKTATGVARNVAFNANVAPNETKVIHGALGQTLESGGVLAAGSDLVASLDFVTSAYESNI